MIVGNEIRNPLRPEDIIMLAGSGVIGAAPGNVFLRLDQSKRPMILDRSKRKFQIHKA